MGRSVMIPIVLQLYTPDSHTTASEWRTSARHGIPGYGKPTVENLKRYIKRYNHSLRPGGANSHIGRRGRATGGQIRSQKTGAVLAEWRAPTFTTDPTDFDVLYREHD